MSFKALGSDAPDGPSWELRPETKVEVVWLMLRRIRFSKAIGSLHDVDYRQAPLVVSSLCAYITDNCRSIPQE